MTVCLAALVHWFYAPNDIGRAAIVASDRMLTEGDTEFEPPATKVCPIGKRALILVAGEMSAHTEALALTSRDLISTPTDNVLEIANMYGSKIKQIRLRRAVLEYLAPLGLNEHSFIDKQHNMMQQIVYEITHQLQSSRLDVDAVVVGCDDPNLAHIYTVNGRGLVVCHDDICFAAIGSGAQHAKSQFMFSKYPRAIGYYRALPIVYAAKRRAEAAPGVGKDADYYLITRQGWEPMAPPAIAALETVYSKLERTVLEIYDEGALSVEKAIAEHAVQLKVKGVPEISVEMAKSEGNTTATNVQRIQ